MMLKVEKQRATHMMNTKSLEVAAFMEKSHISAMEVDKEEEAFLKQNLDIMLAIDTLTLKESLHEREPT